MLDAARAGDARGFAELFDRHRDRVFSHALRLSPTRADAEDATAVVFLEAWRRQDVVRDVDGSILPWLLVTATNVTRNLNRAARRYRKALDALPRDETARTGPAPAEPDLRAALRALPQHDQALLALTVLEGYSTAEAATALGLTPGAARTRLSRARARLRTQLRPTAEAAPTGQPS